MKKNHKNLVDFRHDFENQNGAFFDLQKRKRVQSLELFYAHQVGAVDIYIHP